MRYLCQRQMARAPRRRPEPPKGQTFPIDGSGRRRAFLDEIQRFREHAATCFEKIMTSSDFPNVAYDVSRSFCFADRSHFVSMKNRYAHILRE